MARKRRTPGQHSDEFSEMINQGLRNTGGPLTPQERAWAKKMITPQRRKTQNGKPQEKPSPRAVIRMPITQARINLGWLAQRAHLHGEYFIVEKDGIPIMGLWALMN